VTDTAHGGTEGEPGPASPAAGGAVIWRHATTAAYVESPARAVVVDLDHLDAPPYVFEGTAAQVWACVDGDRTETEIVTDLAEAYEVAPEVVAPDVRRFVDRLRSLALIVAGPVDDPDS
jgi:hypothetical protein